VALRRARDEGMEEKVVGGGWKKGMYLSSEMADSMKKAINHMFSQ